MRLTLQKNYFSDVSSSLQLLNICDNPSYSSCLSRTAPLFHRRVDVLEGGAGRVAGRGK